MADALFNWVDALWTKARPEGTPPIHVMQRFLASDQDLAVAARVLRRDLKDADLIFHAWQGLLPHANKAPRLSYPAPKKGAEAEELVLKMMSVRRVRREIAEEEMKMVEMSGRLVDLYYEFGVELPSELRNKGGTRKRAKKKKEEAAAPALTGLLAQAKK